MGFKKGDRVKVTAPNHSLTSQTGTVNIVFLDPDTFTVIFDSGRESGFFTHEVEKVEHTEDEQARQQEIEQIANALLVAEHNMDWTWGDALERAGSLYRAGVRFKSDKEN